MPSRKRTFQSSLDAHSPVLSSNFQTLILGAGYELEGHSEEISCRDGGPLVKTTRRKVQSIEIVHGVCDEVVVRILDETRLHRSLSANGGTRW
jgi:hypothetical protein